MGSHPHGTTRLLCTRHVGTGHRIAGQSAGLVVRVTLGHGTEAVLVVLGGSVTTLVTTPVGVVLVLVVVRRTVVDDVDVVRVQRRVVDVVVDGMVGHGRGAVRNSMPQPWYGHSASHGAMSVAVGRAEGQLHGFWIVVWNVQSEKAHVLLQPLFWMVRVAVGHARASGAWARTRLARPRRAESASFILKFLRA